jgi:transcriptional regulator with XRE-family HTH domain
MRRFDTAALFAALDGQRVARGMSWTDVARDTGVSVATIRRTEHGGRMEVDGMLALVDWLGVAVEAFVRDVDR